jgi:hypothetical protein
MKRSRFTEEEEQMDPARAGVHAAVADVCRRHGLSPPTFYACVGLTVMRV